MPKRILVTPRSLTRPIHPALRRLQAAGYELVFAPAGKQPSQEELQQLLPGCVGYLCGVEKVTHAALQSADQLRVISRNGTGVDNIDLDAARKRQVRVCRAEGANARGVAELTLALMLALARAVPSSDRRMKQGAWERREGVELEARTLGLVGCGRIGRMVTQFALAFGMKVLAYDPFPDSSFHPSDRFEFAPLETLWPQADILSLHCPPTPDGQPIVRRETLARMRQGTYLVNTARAGLLNEDDVVAALDSGQLAGLATDVYQEEPPHASPLVDHPKVIATPHLGGFTRESISRSAELAVENLLTALETVADDPAPS